MKKYQIIYADPPWAEALSGKYKNYRLAEKLAYPTMSVDEICRLPVADIADIGCHLWLWTTNQFLRYGFDVMEAWGFKYLAPITWVKPSGVGNYFIHRTQTLLMGYNKKCIFGKARYLPTVLLAESPKRHTEKPLAMQDYIESISGEPRIELFARRKRLGWDTWGNEVESDIELTGGDLE